MTNASRALLVLGSVAVLCSVAGAQPAPATAPTSVLPDAAGRSLLVKNTLTALNHGSITGNFTVLRDLASERFRQAHTAADLAVMFQTLKQLQLDLSPVLVSEPRYTAQPTYDSGRLRLTGYFQTHPKPVAFDLFFQRVEAGWMIDDLTVSLASYQQEHAPLREAAHPRRDVRALPAIR